MKLTKEIIKEISSIKNEPDWMLEFRIKAFEYFMRQDTAYLSDRKDLIDALYRDSINLPLSLDERKQMAEDVQSHKDEDNKQGKDCGYGVL